MKFKQQEEEVQKPNNDQLYDGLSDLIQFEADKKMLIKSAKFYFFDKALTNNEKFFANLYNNCVNTMTCLIDFTFKQYHKLPDFKSAEITNFKDDREPFAIMAEKEEQYVDMINKLITIASSEHNWIVFSYLLKKLDDVKWVCSRALQVFDNKGNVLDLCEQHSKDK